MWPPKKILPFFSEKHLFSDAIGKIGGSGALQFRKARMKARNGRYSYLKTTINIFQIQDTIKCTYNSTRVDTQLGQSSSTGLGCP